MIVGQLLTSFRTALWLGAWALLMSGAAKPQTRTIYIPSGGDSSPRVQEPKTIIDGPVNVVTSDGITHSLSGATISCGDFGDPDPTSAAFSSTESQKLWLRTAADQPLWHPERIEREVLRKKGLSYYWMMLPVGAIRRIVAGPIKAYPNAYVDPAKRAGSTQYIELSVFLTTQKDAVRVWAGDDTCEVKGTEDLREFGKAEFRNKLTGSKGIREVVFASSMRDTMAATTSHTAIVTEVGGKTHELSDFRMQGNVVQLERSGTKLQLNLASVHRIELHDGLQETDVWGFPVTERLAVSVLLNSGAQQDFTWHAVGVVGRSATGWYEWIPGLAIKTIELTSPNLPAAGKVPGSR
jgi:hypothetical protein